MTVNSMLSQPLPITVSRILRAYHLGPDHPMKIRLWTFFRRATGFARLSLPYAKGSLITLDERDYLQRQIYLYGAYEPEVWATIASLIRPGDHFWDVGAHIGAVTLQAILDSRLAACHAFEPDPLQAAVLAWHLEYNDRQHRGVLHQLALSDRDEVRPFFHGSAINSGMSGLQARSETQMFQVTCRCGDQLVYHEGLPPPAIVKLDVEGWELHVFQGMRRLLVEHPPRAFIFESWCGTDGLPTNHDIRTMLIDHGYQVRMIPRSSPSPDQNENFCALRG